MSSHFIHHEKSASIINLFFCTSLVSQDDIYCFMKFPVVFLSSFFKAQHKIFIGAYFTPNDQNYLLRGWAKNFYADDKVCFDLCCICLKMPKPYFAQFFLLNWF